MPVWLPFLVALGLELSFLLGALRQTPVLRRDRGPQPTDRERFGYGGESDELVLVRRDGEELWIPYSGETPDELEELIAEAREQDDEEEPSPDVFPDRRRLGAPLRRFPVGLGAIAALVLVVAFVQARTGWDALSGETRAEAEVLFSSQASAVAEKPVRVRCDDSGGYVGAVQHADGVAAIGGDLAYLTPERCLDTISGTYSGTGALAGVPGRITYVVSGPVTGGTGRFGGVSGTLTWSGFGDLFAGTLGDEVSGTISSVGSA